MQFSQAHIWIEDLLYETVAGSRFTQRSPAMPEVWRTFGVRGRVPQDLLLISNWQQVVHTSLADAVAARLAFGLSKEEAEDVCAAARLAPTQSAAVAELDFRTFVRCALPLSPWWHRYLLPERRLPDGSYQATEPSSYFASQDSFAPLRAALHSELERDQSGSVWGEPSVRDATPPPIRVSGDFVWLARVVGGIWILHRDYYPEGLEHARAERLREWVKKRQQPQELLNALFEVFCAMPPVGAEEPLWSVHMNREAKISMRESTATVKADAARKVFGVSGRGIRWAVLDTGIDATHIAFQKRDGIPHRNGHGEAAHHPKAAAQPLTPQEILERSRIVATYDFTYLRELMSLAPRHLEALSAKRAGRKRTKLPASVGKGLPPSVRSKIEGDAQYRDRLLAALKRTSGQFHCTKEGKAELVQEGRTLDWEVWEPMLMMTHKVGEYEVPRHKHGTHVAGILAADWHAEDLKDDLVVAELGQPRRLTDRIGICPEIELYDFRTLKADGTADEFAVLAALQFVRAINARHEHIQIHGVNLSLSLNHDVSNYACGQTPVCEECERLVGSGVVVVASAGNNGMARYVTTSGMYEEGYRTVSITDPGNAPSVITVGATHRSEPQNYGVSYFSSRGPTGDGRMKPDLVAPGEKVTSTTPGNKEESLDGTSMAAPHVSGAAALLFCRYAELKGKPSEVKRILCETATDLKRERSFQGAGLLDILRAMESM